MSAGDQYNAYRNDVIDSYEKERKTEHRGTKLGDAYDDQTPGIFNNNILITRIELANGLTFKDHFSYIEYGTTKTESNFLNVLFDGYGTYTAGTTKPKAIRVWSGNDHWLLTKESACKYLYVVPLEIEVDQDTFFDILYWNGTYEDLKKAISENTVLKQGHAFLYHDGEAIVGNGSSTVTEIVNQNRSTSSDGLLDTSSPVAPSNTTVEVQTNPGKKDEDMITFVSEQGSTNNNDFNATNGSIELNQTWENIEDIYLIKAPIHQHFALAPDDKRLPLYGGTYRIVYKNGDTQDIPTFSTLTYFYSMKEIRTCQIPTVTNPTDFDWFSHEEEQYRHIPMVVVRPSNPETRIRVLDSLDASSFTSIDVIPDIYYAELNSKKICSFQVEDGFTVLEEPTKKELDFTDKIFDISGFKVLYKDTTKSKNIQYSADAGTLYINNKDITDDEYSLGNEKMVISREVYAKNEDDTTEKLVTTLSYPVSEATLVDIVASSGVTIPGTSTNSSEEEPETIDDDEGALAVSKAQKSLGANEDQNVEETSLFSLQYHRTDGLVDRFKKGIGDYFKKQKERMKVIREKLKEELKKKVRSAALQGVDGIAERIKSVVTSVTLQSMELGETVEVKTSIRRYMVSNHIVPPIPQGVSEKYSNNLGVIPWPAILKYGQMILPYAIKGVKWLVRKIKKKALSKRLPNVAAIAHGYTDKGIPYAYEEEVEWRDSTVNGVCADAVILGYNPNTNSNDTTLPLKILSQGQAFNIVLHHPQNFSNMSNELRASTIIGIRCLKPPISNQMGYGENFGSSATGSADQDVGEWVAVNSNNEDIPVTLTLANGGIVCPIIKWSPPISKGTAEQEVKMTINGLNRLKALGYRVAPHLLALNNGEEDGLFGGILSLYNRGRIFMESHPRLTELTKRGVSWAAGRIMNRNAPTERSFSTDYEETVTKLEEPDMVSDLSITNSINVEQSSDSSIDDESFVNIVAIEFDGNYPSRKDITLTNITNFFESAKVCIIYEDDEEYTGKVGTGLSRTYLDDGEFVPPTNLARDLLEFGTSNVNIRGMTFSLGTNTLTKDLFNAFHYGDTHQLVMVSAPDKLVYTFGDRRMDLTGASWNIIRKSDGAIVISGLTEENLIVEDLPTNIENCELEIPDNDSDKTTIRVHFFGFTNDEIKVTLLHPYIVAQEEQNALGSISKSTAYNLLGISSTFKAPSSFMCTRVWPMNEGTDASWPTTNRQLMINLKTKIVLRDTFMRRKVFNVEDLSQDTFDKIYTISNYNPSSANTIQQITVQCMGHSTQKWISLDAVANAEEEALDNVTTITDNNVSENPPSTEWNESDPDGTSYATAYGSCLTLEEDSTDPIMVSCRRILSETKSGYRGETATSIPTDSLYTHGKTKLESVFSEDIITYYLHSTGLRHHDAYLLKGFFKKLWRKIKKGAKVVYKKIIKPTAKFIGGAVKTVAETLISTAAGALGTLTGGSVGEDVESGGGEYVDEPTAIFYKPSDLLGSNGELLLTPIHHRENSNGFSNSAIPWMGCSIKSYYSTSLGKNRLVRIWGDRGRFSGGYAIRRPIHIPGMSTILTSRRMVSGADPYPAKIFTTATSGVITADQNVFFDAIEMIGVNTFDENTVMLTSSSVLTSMTFYYYSFCMSSADLLVGDTWPTIEELEQITTLYAQRTSDLKWVAIPFSHESITVTNYSSTDDMMEQLVTITLTVGQTTYTTYAIFYRTMSNLKIVQDSDQCFVWLFQHPYASGGSYIAYLGERRHNGNLLPTEEQPSTINYKNADTVKIVDAENRRILSINNYEDNAESMFWESNISANTILGYFKVARLDQSESVNYLLYAFTYTRGDDYVEVMLYDESKQYYVSKDGILYAYNGNLEGMVIVGYDPETTSTTATIRKVVKVVDHFSE